ncbi:hypothetical protein [Geodermatophilus sabuli]|uniref:Uncharacterized protein n=1 Tax=Geodermatophilus sabuli TaxID=1564158 RepID=A0A285E635_9ACTN|nr:hypothetical protein [Geodermatophilus sabuli]MBB3082564.1 hypothetical protein [Geodermatophilus sabuli]SNX94568.1 hypothetical protein SAMN06893097_101364 [Geodermatophilus sabuli]
MAGRRRRAQDEPLAVRALREQERHTAQVAAYGFFPARGPRRSATVTPAPLRYWQYDPPRPWLLLAAVVLVVVWLALFAWTGGTSAALGELPLALLLGVAVVVLSAARMTVSDSGLSFDVAGLRRTSSLHVVPRSLVREVRRGTPPEGWPKGRSRGGWWPGRTRVAVRHLAAGGDGEKTLTVWVRDPEAFAAALGVPLA